MWVSTVLYELMLKLGIIEKMIMNEGVILREERYLIINNFELRVSIISPGYERLGSILRKRVPTQLFNSSKDKIKGN